SLPFLPRLLRPPHSLRAPRPSPPLGRALLLPIPLLSNLRSQVHQSPSLSPSPSLNVPLPEGRRIPLHLHTSSPPHPHTPSTPPHEPPSSPPRRSIDSTGTGRGDADDGARGL